MTCLAPTESLIVAFNELLCAAQTFVREAMGGERSACSLRDIARAISVYSWFGEHFSHAYGYTMQQFYTAAPHCRKHIRVYAFARTHPHAHLHARTHART